MKICYCPKCYPMTHVLGTPEGNADKQCIAEDNSGCATCGRPLTGLADMTMVLAQVFSSLSKPRPINCLACEVASNHRKKQCKRS